ncbi:protein ENDOPLASMIC RETICULUM-ARRESTED PEN3 [Silene latifolia]|uniref:protein ENDOPLASMIC RETICULUM-ARRESTED PEN3 n=1 Tax=Silene latifolia TaxID=37657 RepID=UPI003D7711AD
MDSDFHSTSNHRVKLNVGGKHFETTLSTLRHTPIHLPHLLTTASTTPIFFDADPHHFTTLLSTARTHHHLTPSPFTPYDSSHTTTLTPPLSPFISTFAPPTTTTTTAPTTAPITLPLLLGHNNLISHYHPTTLTHLSTIPTHLPLITSISALSSTVSAVASSSRPGLHFFSDHHISTVLWSDPTDLRTLSSHVTSLTSPPSSSTVFACFKTRHAENTILVIDKTTLKISSEIGRQSGNTSKSAALTKLTCVQQLGLLVGSAVTCSAFGYSGYVRIWDVRSGKTLWETSGEGRGRRLGDGIADVDVDEETGIMAKVGSRSGDVGVADLRMLGGGGDEDPWVYLEEVNPGLRGTGAVRGSVVVHCWNKHVFVGRDGALEAWSMVNGGGYRRNFMDKEEEEEEEKKGRIRMIGGGGNRLFVARDDVEGLEVWETSTSSGLITLS